MCTAFLLNCVSNLIDKLTKHDFFVVFLYEIHVFNVKNITSNTPVTTWFGSGRDLAPFVKHTWYKLVAQ